MKKIKNFLLVLLLIPCMLLVGCSQDISSQEYEVLMGDAATNYYQNYYGKNMTIVVDGEYSVSGTDAVHYGYDGAYTLAEYSSAGKGQQIIEVFASEIKGMPNIRVTSFSDVMEDGFEENEYEDGIVSYTSSYTQEQVVTFICKLVNGKKEVTAYSYAETCEIKNNGEEVREIKKSSYTYPTEEAGIDAIEELLADIDNSIINLIFYNPGAIAESVGSKVDYFKTNNGAGWEVELQASGVVGYNQSIADESIAIKTELSNNLPYQINLQTKSSEISSISPDDYAKIDYEREIEVSIDFNCDPISKPQGFNNVANEEPYVYIEYVGVNF